MSEIQWSVAAAADELWEGDLLDVEVDDEPVLLVHMYGGQIKAFQGLCPHQEILLADGKWDPDTQRLLCPGHNWEFDLTTGAGINPAGGCRLYEYPVEVDGDEIKVGIPQDGDSHHLRFST